MRRILLAAVVAFMAPTASAGEALQIEVNKAELLKLGEDASVVMVANPSIVDVAVESPRLIFLLGRRPGETNMFVLDADGSEIFTSEVVVVPPEDRAVSVHRSTEEEILSCDPRCVGVSVGGLPAGALAAAAPAVPPTGGEAPAAAGAATPTTGAGAPAAE